MSLFEHYPATPGSVRSAGKAIIHAGSRVSDVAQAVDRAHNGALSVVDGLLAMPLLTAPASVRQSAQSTNQSAILAGGAANLFASNIETYNDGIDKLNERYAAAKASSFHVDADRFFMHGGSQTPAQRQAAYDGAVRNAEAALVSSLTAEKRKLDQQLDQDAEHVSGMLRRGPSAGAIYELAAAGAIPPNVALAYPGIDTSFVKELIKGGTTAWKLYSKVLRIRGNLEAAKLAVAAWNEMDAGRSMIPFARTFDDVVDVFGQLDNGDDYMALYAQMRNAEWLSNAARAGIPMSKFAKGLAGVGILAGGYDLFANPDGHTGARRGIDMGMDVVGIGASGAALAVATGLLVVNPVGLTVIAVAGGVTAAWAAGNYIYDHWDDITAGVDAAKDWVGDRASDVVDKAGDVVDDIGDGISGAWHGVFG
ncbi:MAG TPA: hypothetical protein VH419_07830 [Nocardioidaceae bacterium]